MAKLGDDLAALPLFNRCPPAALAASANHWRARALVEGERLWEQGVESDGLGVLVYGECAAIVDGVEIGKVRAGELVGEVSAFFNEADRSARVVARKPSHVLLLPTDGLRQLRWHRSPVYEALLDQALKTMVHRVTSSNDRYGRLARGEHAMPTRREPSALARLWRSFRPGRPAGPCPPLEPLLRELPGLREVDPEVLASMQAAFEAVPLEEGQALFLEGEPGDSAWLVAEGQIDVLRNVRGDRAERLSVMKRGDLLGINTLLVKGPRTASCVAATPGWAWKIGFDACNQLRADARLWWRECLLAAMASQLRLASAALQRALGAQAGLRDPPGPRPPEDEDSFEKLLHASGFLEVLPADSETLKGLRYVHDEDHRRNPKNRPR